MSPVNEAAWSLEAKGDLKVLTAPYTTPSQNEIVVKVCSIYMSHYQG